MLKQLEGKFSSLAVDRLLSLSQNKVFLDIFTHLPGILNGGALSISRYQAFANFRGPFPHKLSSAQKSIRKLYRTPDFRWSTRARNPRPVCVVIIRFSTNLLFGRLRFVEGLQNLRYVLEYTNVAAVRLRDRVRAWHGVSFVCSCLHFLTLLATVDTPL